MAISSLVLVLILTILTIHGSNAWSDGTDSSDPVASLTMQFTRVYPLQTPPISTVYGAIVTNILKVVDCDYVQVENIDHNSPQEGQFSYRTTVPVLTRYHVTCMDPSTIITRQAEVAIATQHPQVLESTYNDGQMSQKDRRDSNAAASFDTLIRIAEKLSSGIDPTNENITVRDFRYLLEINTALFALNIVNSGLPLGIMCQYLQDPTIANKLEDNYINQKQAADIVCFASVYGLYLGQSNDQVLADLAALEYAVQMHAYHSRSLQGACRSLSYGTAQMLGIDAEGIQKNICNGTAGISAVSSLLPAPVPTPSRAATGSTGFTLPFPTATPGTAWTSNGTGASWRPIYPTPSSGPYPGTTVSSLNTGTGSWNITVPTATGSWETTTSPQSTVLINTGSSVVFGTGGSIFSSATSAGGTVAPWFNITVPSSTPTAGVASVMSSGQLTPSKGFTSFFVPPRLVRDRLRRHG